MRALVRSIGMVVVLHVFSFHSHGATVDDLSMTRPGMHRVSESVLVVDAEGTNCVVIAGSKGLVVIDTGPGPAAAADLRDAAAEVFGRTDVAYVISTHCHWDHVDGNQVFDGVPIIAHGNCPAAMERSFADRSRLMKESPPTASAPPPPPPGATLPPPEGGGHARAVGPGGESEGFRKALRERFTVVDLTLPQVTFTDRMTVDLGNLSLNLIGFGGGHSSSDILIVVPEEGLLISGDIFFHHQLPLVTGDGTPEPNRWLVALDLLDEHTEIQTVIPGHGEFVSLQELNFFESYLRWLVTETATAPPGADAADSLLRGVLSLERAPSPAPDLDPEIAATVHRANVVALVEGSGLGSS